MMSTLRTLSPAKLNLGLEITGKRADGYHSLVSIFQAISLVDTMEFRAPAEESTLRVLCNDSDVPELIPGNLVTKAMEIVEAHTATPLPVSVTLHKHIPVASGLGGASSNAATALRAASALRDTPLQDLTLAHLARRLGSDVPFFLTGGTALVTGTGSEIQSLPPLANTWFVLLSPRLQQPIANKTATLYRSLTERDFSSGEAVQKQVDNCRAGVPLGPSQLVNPFQRHLLAIRPELAPLLDSFTASGAPFIAMSGAGPTHYTFVGSRDEAERIATGTRSRLGDQAAVFVAITCPELPPLEKSVSFT